MRCLSTSARGPIEKQIQILDENRGESHYRCKMFMKFSLCWFDKKKGPYSRDCGLQKEEIFEEVKRFFLQQSSFQSSNGY